MSTPQGFDLPPGVGEPAVAAGERRAPAPSLLAYPATYTLVGINILLFLLMIPGSAIGAVIHAHAWSQVMTASFDFTTLLRWGGCDAALILDYGQWWRLLSATFLHANVLHILVNMWCLWNLGFFGEPLLGKRGLVAVYVLTGVTGNMLSLAWAAFTRTDTLVVGASGAIFGIAGILIVLLSNRKLSLPWKELRSLRSQVVFFAMANLLLGVAPQVFPIFSPANLARLHIGSDTFLRTDNSAHVGGFVAGLALGMPLFPRMTSGSSTYRARQRMTFTAAALLLCLVAYALAAFAHARGV
jgi:rhomboid protease GluP